MALIRNPGTDFNLRQKLESSSLSPSTSSRSLDWSVLLVWSVFSSTGDGSLSSTGFLSGFLLELSGLMAGVLGLVAWLEGVSEASWVETDGSLSLTELLSEPSGVMTGVLGLVASLEGVSEASCVETDGSLTSTGLLSEPSGVMAGVLGLVASLECVSEAPCEEQDGG